MADVFLFVSKLKLLFSQGLFYAGQSFGPGVVTYPGGSQDVGLWHSKRLQRLCTALEDGFSLKNFPEYASYMDPAAATDLTQVPGDPHSHYICINIWYIILNNSCSKICVCTKNI